MYSVFVTDFALKNLQKLKRHGKENLRQIHRLLAELKTDPYGMTQELHAPLQGFRSLHSGRFRAVIRIVDQKLYVYIVGIGWHESGDRDDIYQVVQRALASGVIKLDNP